MEDKSPVRFDIKAEQADFASFIAAVESSSQIVRTSYTPSDDKNHFVIYKFTENSSGGKCVVVYDTKATKITLDARPDVLERFKQLYIKRDSLALDKTAKDTSVPMTAPHHNKGRLPATRHSGVPAQKPAQTGSKLPQQQQSRQTKPAVKPQPTQQSKPQPKSEPAEPEYKNGYAIKKYTRKRFDDALRGIKAMKGVTYKSDAVANKGKPDEAETYIVSDKKAQKVILRYMPKKEILQMQGKRSYLFSEVQVLLLKDADFKSAVVSHMEAETGKNTQSALTMQRRLKKILPDAFDFLSEPSKIELSIGYIDINNSQNNLSDYSSLLTPPYRGLEKFIRDLQKARGIEVKMIGQGYEKDENGNYRLKSGYRKRIDSVVYNEVMSSLYTEYFARRNFYTHSDFEDETALRIITDRQEVQRIFDHLIEVINYNSKKLKEIGFTM